MPRFTDKTVIVTGAAGALGAGMVRRFAAEDARVVVGARRREQVTGLLDELGTDRAVFAQLDVTSEQDWTAVVATAEAAFGPVSVLVNNAARAIVGTTMSLTPDEFREVIDTNLVGTFLGTRAAVPSMRRRGGGSIVNINSTAGIGAAAGLAAYGTSKWGIRGLTRISAKELGRDNIRVNGVHPGIIETPLAYDPATGELIVGIDDQPIPRLADVDEISSLVLFVASDDAGYSTGAEFVADGGYLLGPVPAAKP
ncbi:SDR family NAD(P)-dependent oxidoreductase [Streptomyces mirabilis]|uniref:SDR family NAD(P)-dependent oxidoreductase n=1 Tax=Streptomyces mirabilis TaxID=68239 RepID=UPI0021BF29F1|nr:SDR family NAD(P)-dependent oxidoreductase [Streptomyces mirabilis]MCT9108127.1 SDR family oxidoreductase [Streptomyces mirabilis]